MALLSIGNYFLALSIVATILLWGLSLCNGTVTEIVHAVLRGHFEDGTPLRTRYTGIYILDTPLSMLVAFFFYGTNGTDKGSQLFLIDAYASLQSAFVWLVIESSRTGEKPFAVANPIIWGLLWQAFGAAISLPLYYLHHLKWLAGTKPAFRPVPLSAARAVPFAFVIGAVIPAVIGMLPTWIDRSAMTHQVILGAWQPDPVWVSIIQTAVTALLVRFQGTDDTDEISSHRAVRSSYLLAALFSAVGHLYTTLSITLSHDPKLSLTRVYMPFIRTGPVGTDKRLLRGSWLFLQFDLIIITLSSLSWACVLLADIASDRGFARRTLPIVLSICGVLLGPGATVSLALFWREGVSKRLHSSGGAAGASKSGQCRVIGDRKATVEETDL